MSEEYNIANFNELIDNSAFYKGGDVLRFIADITAMRNIGDIFSAGGNYIIYGDNYGFDGNNYKGFLLNANTNLTVNDFNMFQNFQTSTNGGVFENNGTLTINNSIFNSDSANRGGAVFNKGVLNVVNSTFTDNGTTANTGFGGALRSESGTLNISNSTFSGNKSNTFGGAIAANNTRVYITGSTFENNTVVGSNYNTGRGGVMSTNAYASITDSIFRNNSSTSYGGALNINNDMYIDNSLFEGNFTIDNGLRVNGGAIRAETGKSVINNSTFTNNSAAWGGAISSDSTASLIIMNSIFENNTAQDVGSATSNASGGAITNGSTLLIINSIIKNNQSAFRGGGVNFNGTILNIAATGEESNSTYGNSTGDTLFDGNKLLNGTSNGLTVYQNLQAPVVNLNAGNNGTLTFNDAIIAGQSTLDDAIVFNINRALDYGEIAGVFYSAPVDGTVIFNNSVGGLVESIINLFFGTLKIGGNGSFTNVSLNLNGGIFDTQNGVVNNLNFNDFNINDNTSWKTDVNLADGTSDYLNISGTASAAGNSLLTFEAIRLLNDFNDSEKVMGNTKEIYYSNKNLNTSPLASMAYNQGVLNYISTGASYSVVSGFDTNGSKLSFTYEGTGGLPYAVSLDGTRVYSGTADEKVTSWINNNNNMQGERLIINGNNYSVTNDSGGVLRGIVIGLENTNQSIEIEDVSNWSGFSDSYIVTQSAGDFVYGGAFATLGGAGNVSSLTINNVSFSDNNTGSDTTPYYRSFGGAISVTNSAASAFGDIMNSTFENNSAVGRDAYGGAISVSLGNLNILNGNFTNNLVKSVIYNGTNGMNAYGGAIYLAFQNSKLNIQNTQFNSNIANSFETGGGYQRANGGAISTEAQTSAYIYNTSFTSNNAQGYNANGGAINNSGTMNLNDASFTGNFASATGTAQGGAISNSGTLGIIATDRDFVFTNNYVEKISRAQDGTISVISKDNEALYNTGTVNLNSASGKAVVFNDKFNGNNGIVNINNDRVSYTDFVNAFTAQTEGNIVFNNTVKNQTINLYNGVVSIGKDVGYLLSGDNYFDNINVNTYGGTFDTQNGQTDNLSLIGLAINNNTKFAIDVDLASKTSDYFTVEGNITGSGSFIIDSIKILSDMSDAENFVDTDFINKPLPNGVVSENAKTIATNKFIYGVSLINNNTTLRFQKDSPSLGLPEAVANHEVTEYYLTGDEIVEAWLEPTQNNMQGDLTIFGNYHSIVAENNLKGINTNGYTLTINDTGEYRNNIIDESMRDFDNALINTLNGTLNINNSTFTSNIAKNSYVDTSPPYQQGLDGEDIVTELVGGNGAAIKNESGIVNINGAVFSGNSSENIGGAIYNNGIVNLVSSSTADVIFEKNTAMTAEPMNTYSNDIYQTATGETIISGESGNVVLGGGFAGEGTVAKQGKNQMILGSSSDSSKFTGDFTLTDGTLSVNSNAGFLGGTSEMTGGILNWATAKTLTDTASLSIRAGDVNILDGGHLILNDKTIIDFTNNPTVTIQQGGILENTIPDLTVTGGNITGYSGGTDFTYGTFKNTGNLTLLGDNSVFKGTFLQTEGQTDAQADTLLFENTDLQGGTINFNDNASFKQGSTFTSAGSNANKTVAMNNNTNTSYILEVLAVATNKNLTVKINNTSGNAVTTTLQDTNLNDEIVSLQVLDNNLNGGVINTAQRASLIVNAATQDLDVQNNEINLNGNSKFEINTQNANTIKLGGNTEITGNARAVTGYSDTTGGIIKNGTGILELNADASNFIGTFIQNAGSTVVSTNGYLFAGTKDILSGTIDVNSNTGIYYKDLYLSDNTILTNNSSIPEGGTIESDTLEFTGSGANAIFTSINMPEKVNYFLSANIENGNKNTITFENAKVSLGIENFTGETTYVFNDSTLNFNRTEPGTRDYIFSKLNSQNTSIDLKIDFVNDSGTIKLATDTLNISDIDITGGNIFELGNVLIYDADLEDGSRIYNTVKDVLQGEAIFKDQEPSVIISEGATTIYEYELSLTANDKSIQLENIGPADDTSLNQINIKNINRFFNFSKGTGSSPEYYYNRDSLDPAGTGNFTVSGATDNYEDSILSGILTSTGEKGSLFNMAQETYLTLQNMTIENTYKAQSGSVVSIGTSSTPNTLAKTTIQNVLVQNTASDNDGGAIFNNGGTFVINNSEFYDNESDLKGGVIKNQSGDVYIYNSKFGSDGKANTAVDGGVIKTDSGSNTQISFSAFNNNSASQNGGVIYNEGNITILESTSFLNNSTTTGRGGAIYNDGELLISPSTNFDIVFSNNTDSIGKNDIFQTDSATTTINSNGGKVLINSGIAGTGEILKEGTSELILNTDSVNVGFTGDFNLLSGITSIYGEFFGGQSTINNTGILNWNTLTEKISQAILTAQGGTVNVNGKLTLNNANDALNQNAKININNDSLLDLQEGYVSLDKNGNPTDVANFDRWSGAIVQTGGTLDYDIDTNGLLQSSGGNINVNGGNLTLENEIVSGSTYSSYISENTNINIKNDSTLTMNSAESYLDLNSGDNWGTDATINLENGTLNYTDNIGNGKIIAEGGNLNVIDSNLILNNPSDLINKNTVLNINSGSLLEINAGNVVANAGDNIQSVTEINNTGTFTADGYSNTDDIKQNGGTFNINNNSVITLDNPNSYINLGTVSVDNSVLLATKDVSSLNFTDLSMKNNAIFNAQKDFSVTNNLNIGNSYISTINNEIGSSSITNMIVSSGQTAGFGIDINPRDKTSDRFIIDNIMTDNAGTGIINISDLNFLGLSPIDENVKFQIFDAQNISDNIIFTATDKSYLTPIGNYNLYSEGGGYYDLRLTGFNPQVFRGQAAVLAEYQNQLIVNNILLNHIMLVSQQVIASEHLNKYAATLPQFAPYQYSKKDGGIWYKNYVNFETLYATQGLDIGNISYGALVGADFPMVDLKRGWKLIPTTYIAYNGGHQYFDGIGTYQNGGQGGAMATLIKNDFIASVLGYAGGYGNEMSVSQYQDNTGNWFAGTAAKLAYNLNITPNLVIQPTALISYNIFGKQNWSSDFGIFSMNSGLLNGINTAPGVNIIYAQEDWSLYLTAQYMFNINDGISGSAGNVQLPDIRMQHGYIEYGAGITKKWKDRLKAYGEFTIRNGGRNGISLQFGVEYAL